MCPNESGSLIKSKDQLPAADPVN